MKNVLHAVPAYGRKYDDTADILLDWLGGKDFRIVGGSYFSIRDTDALVHNLHVDLVSVNDYLIPLK